MWNYYYGIPKALGPKWKVPLIKKRLLSFAVKAFCLLKDWCSHIKSAPWKVLPKLANCIGYFSLLSIMFHFQGMFIRIIKVLISGFALFVCEFNHFNKRSLFETISAHLYVCIFRSFFCQLFLHSFFVHSPSVPLLRATGFVVHFLLLSHHSKCRAFFWHAAKQGNEKWLTQFSSSSFSLALLLSNTCTHALAHTYTDGRTHTHTRAQPQPKTHIPAVWIHFHRWLVKSPQLKDTQICKAVRGFLSMSTLHDIHVVEADTEERNGAATPLISCHS